MRREGDGLDVAGIKCGKLSVAEHTMGMEQDPAMLRNARPFDRAFVDMWVPHHQAAIRMAHAELSDGSDAAVGVDYDAAQSSAGARCLEVRTSA